METKERPIIFSTWAIPKLLDGSKTQTRRPIKPQPLLTDYENDDNAMWLWLHKCSWWLKNSPEESGILDYCPYGQVGDRLWVRETWATEEGYDYLSPSELDCLTKAYYIDKNLRAKGEYSLFTQIGKTRPSIFMPRWASRIDLEITEIRAERLQDITPSDAVAEGALPYNLHGWLKEVSDFNFQLLWDSINGKKYPWDSNCWVWVISFKKEEG